MYRPNKFCTIRRSGGKTDVYGQPVSGLTFRERCAVVRLEVRNAKSSVRADTSASRGSARERETPHAIILLGPFTAGRIDDIIDVGGVLLRIMSLEQRFDIDGRMDHYEITCSYWGRA